MDESAWVFTALITVTVYLFYRYLASAYTYWKELGVPYPEASILFGNIRDAIILRRSIGQIYTQIYEQFNGLPYVGMYKIRQPVVLIRDPEIVRDVLVKEFNSFHDNDVEVDETIDPIIAKNPFMLRGQQWKTTRAQLSTCFTSGKMKNLFPLMVEVSKNMVSYIEKESQMCENGLETKELAAKFTTDNVASCAFGLEGKTFEDPKSEFRKIGRKILEPSFIMGLKLMCIFMFPSVSKFLRIKFIPADAEDYLKHIISGTLKYRKENGVIRNDFLDIMSEFRDKLGDNEFSDEDILAHALSFFVDGFETSSIVLSFTLFELAANPSCQERLKLEIDETIAKHGGSLSYDAIQEMSYLDSVICESLRLHPAAMFLIKLCTASYVLPHITATRKPVQLDAGTSIAIPVYGLHHDEKYFPEPNNFDPERFSESNRGNIVKGTYLPFGDGPRICLGQRFALLQIKVAVVAIISNFEVRVNKKTITPIEVDPKYFMLIAKGGLWLDYRKRSESS